MHTISKSITDNNINEQFIDKICKRIAENKSVRRSLPLNGRLHIDRPLPFICVYRKPTKSDDRGTEKLVKGEASYLIASSSTKIKPGLSLLMQNIVSLMSNEHKAFLIIEVWTKKGISSENNNSLGISNPHIKIKISKDRFHTDTVETLEKALEIIYVQRKKVKADIVYDKKQWPEKMAPLVSSAFAKAMNCFMIGIEVDPFYQNSITGELYPLVLKKLHQGLSRAIKLGVYQFSHHQTNLRPTNYQSLGRRAMVKAVWEVDQKLAEISNAYDFLLLVTPINIDQSWNKFKSSKFKKSPSFYYRPIPVNPSALKTKLYNIHLIKLKTRHCPTYFIEKQVELEKTLSMLRDRRTRNFFYGSMQLYGEITTT